MARARFALLVLLSPVCFLVPFRTPLPRDGLQGERQSKVFHASTVGKAMDRRSLKVVSRSATSDEVEVDAGEAEPKKLRADIRPYGGEETLSTRVLVDCHDIPVMDHSLRLLATLSYLLPAVDAWRFFALGLASECWPTVYRAWIIFTATVPQDLEHVYAALHPLLLFMMAQIATRRRLPRLLRFNIYQAFLLDLLTCIAFRASSFAHWLAQSTGHAIYVPTEAEPTILPGTQLVLLLLAICMAYSVCSTLSTGSAPNRIPYISAEATKSLGTNAAVLKHSEYRE